MSRRNRLQGFAASPVAWLLVTTALTTVAAVVVTWPLARQPASATLGSGEVLLTAWQLNWFQHAMLTNPLSWVDANIFFPYQNTATLNDLLLTHALVTLPVAWAPSPVLALNLALLGGIVLCGVFAHLLVVELTGSPWAGTVGGTLFALTPFRFLHLGHLSIAAAWAIPLFFWALLRHLRRPSWGGAALTVASGLAVGLSSLYHAAYVAPIIPLVLLVGARRGPGGGRTWLPLLATGLPGLALLGFFLAPYAAALASFGVASAPSDLSRYGADLSSLGQKPGFMAGTGSETPVDPEARLYPGLALALLAVAGAFLGLTSAWRRPGWCRYATLAVLVLAGALGLGFVTVPDDGVLRTAWVTAVLALIWVGPFLALFWAIRQTGPQDPVGPAMALRLGIAGAVLSFVLALGPEARYLSEALGPAPYGLLAQVSSAFEGTRAPARYGGLVVLFLALIAAAPVAALARRRGVRRVAGFAVTVAALVVCLGELPAPPLPQGRELVPLPDLQDPAYAWIAERPGRFGILELPDWPSRGGKDYEYRGWRSLRYMLASKQHGQHLVNGTGRIRPFLWRRLRRLKLWGDEFFTFVSSYLPVDYVLVHEAGIPARSREAARARLDETVAGWTEVFRSADVRVFTVDRSAGRGTHVDRLFLRREVAPRAVVSFSARAAPAGEAAAAVGAQAPTALELLHDGDLVATWRISSGWQALQATIDVDARPQPGLAGWPRATTLLRWKVPDDTGALLEIRDLSVVQRGGSGRSARGHTSRVPTKEVPREAQ